MSREFAIGDIHGCESALETLLDMLDLNSDDRVILLGDVIDRGPDSRAVVETLLNLGNFCRMDFIMGNHEQMLLDSMHNHEISNLWFGWGGAETVQSYGGRFSDIPEEHIEFMANALPYLETETHICIHANLEPGVALDEQSAQWLRWQHVTGMESPHESGKQVVCGHTQMPDVPGVADGWAMIDTGAYKGGFLTALDLGSGEIIQAGQNAQTRRGVYLDELT